MEKVRKKFKMKKLSIADALRENFLLRRFLTFVRKEISNPFLGRRWLRRRALKVLQ